MTKLLISLSILFTFTACSELDNLSENKMGGDNVTVPSNPDTPVTPPTNPDNPTNPDTPITPPTDPDNPANPNTPVTPPTDPDKPVDKRPICPTIISNDELTTIAKKYLGFSIGVGNFIAYNEQQLIGNVTDRAKAERLKITPVDRIRILRAYGIIRFVISTKEFRDEFMKPEYNYPSGNAVDCKNEPNICTGKVVKGEQLDREKFLEVIRKFGINIGVKKLALDEGINGSAGLGPFLYLHNDNSWVWNKQRVGYINLPNHISWSEPYNGELNNVYADDVFLARLLFHESLHIAGFDHYEPNGHVNHSDAVYMAQKVFLQTYDNGAFKTKYSKELKELERYYTESYANWIDYETFIFPNDSCRPAEPRNKNRSISVLKEQREYEKNMPIISCNID